MKNKTENFIADLDVLFTEEQASGLLNYSQRTLQQWRRDGRGPKFVKVSSRSIRYRKRDLIEWFNKLTRRSTSDCGD